MKHFVLFSYKSIVLHVTETNKLVMFGLLYIKLYKRVAYIPALMIENFPGWLRLITVEPFLLSLDALAMAPPSTTRSSSGQRSQNSWEKKLALGKLPLQKHTPNISQLILHNSQ